MGRKIFYLVAALAFPIAIFLFLKFFGKNEFAVEPLYQESIPSKGCPYAYDLPYAVPDSVRDIIADSNALAVVTLMGKEKADEADKLIRRLESLFKTDPVSFHKMDETTAGDGYPVLRECVFLLAADTTVAVIDRDGRIRGQYTPASMEDIDRLIVELKIILKKF